MNVKSTFLKWFIENVSAISNNILSKQLPEKIVSIGTIRYGVHRNWPVFVINKMSTTNETNTYSFRFFFFL